MPDIISKIRLEATGGDQAAREVRKVKDAYDDVSASASGISATVGGDYSAFARATAAGGGAPGAPGGSATVTDFDESQRRHGDSVAAGEQRVDATRRSGGSGYLGLQNAALGAGQQLGGGQALGAAGTALAGLGGAVAGIALPALAVAGILKAGQSLVNNEGELWELVYGSGASQRLGVDATKLRDWYVGTRETGVPTPMLQEFMQTLSATGFNATDRGALSYMRGSTELTAQAGVSGSVLGSLGGTIARSNLQMLKAEGLYDLANRGAGAFGKENLDRFFTKLTETLESVMAQGIVLTDEDIRAQTVTQGALAKYGGFSVTGAQAAEEAMRSRGVGAAQLATPGDIIAFNLARRREGMPEGETVFETLKWMETPAGGLATTANMFQYLEGVTPDDFNLANRMRMYFKEKGQDVKYGAIQKMMDTYRGTGEVTITPEERVAAGGAEATAETLAKANIRKASDIVSPEVAADIVKGVGQEVFKQKLEWLVVPGVTDADGKPVLKEYWTATDPGRLHYAAVQQKLLDEFSKWFSDIMDRIKLELLPGVPAALNTAYVGWEGYEGGTWLPAEAKLLLGESFKAASEAVVTGIKEDIVEPFVENVKTIKEFVGEDKALAADQGRRAALYATEAGRPTFDALIDAAKEREQHWIAPYGSHLQSLTQSEIFQQKFGPYAKDVQIGGEGKEETWYELLLSIAERVTPIGDPRGSVTTRDIPMLYALVAENMDALVTALKDDELTTKDLTAMLKQEHGFLPYTIEDAKSD